MTNTQPLSDRLLVKRNEKQEASQPVPAGPDVRTKTAKRIHLTLTAEELDLLVSLASDQLFRRQFIDPKMPGYKGNPEEVSRGKALLNRIRQGDDAARGVAAMSQRASAKEREI